MNVNYIFKKYNANESSAIHDYPNYALKAFTPNTFLRNNFPTHLASTQDLWKFVDTMHEFRLNKYFLYNVKSYINNNTLHIVNF